MRWGLTGYYGFGNLGDDLMLAILAREIRELDADARVSVICPPGASAERVPGEEVMGPRDVRVPSGWGERWGAVRDTDALVFGGGTCLHRFGFCAIHASAVARLLGRPVRWVGVGAEDPGGGLRRLKARLALSLCGGAGFRDEHSLEVAEEISGGVGKKARVTGELAYLLERVADGPEASRTPAGEEASTLVVSFRELEGYLPPAGRAQAVEHAGKAVARAVREMGFRRVVCLNLADGVDGAVTNRLAARLERELQDRAELVVADGVSLTAKLQHLARAELVLSVRLHGWLVARLLGTPAVGVAYADKVREQARALDRPAVLELDSLVSGPEAVYDAMAREAENPSEFLDLERARAGARKNIEMLAELLDGRS